jgi:hypothetical protein
LQKIGKEGKKKMKVLMLRFLIPPIQISSKEADDDASF